METDSDGLDVYRCIRGTSQLESYHQKLEMIFSSWNASPEYAEAIFTVVRHMHNIWQSEKNRPRFPCLGHFDHYLVDKTSQSITNLTGECPFVWWSTSAFNSKTSLSFGFVPTLPIHLRDNVNPSDVKSYKSIYAFFALKQQQLIPFLPIHTEVEKLLFIRNVGNYLGGGMTSKRLSPASAFDNAKMADDWVNGKLALNGSLSPPSVANGIFKKTPNHLNSFFKVSLYFVSWFTSL
jgi:hypothetical protein